jgi:hypothetical protein
MKQRLMLMVVVALIALTASVALGQSGRKSKKAETQPPIQGVNQPDTRVVPEPEAQTAKPKEKPLTILIASDMADLMGASFYADIARQACVAELRENRALDIQEQKDANRAEASKRAKQDEIFVVHLELRTSAFASSSAGSSFDLLFTIYEPKTGKVAGSGSGYPSQGARMPIPSGGYGYEQRNVEMMGRDAARKALKLIREKAPVVTP